MKTHVETPKILLISQWPNVKNGEYELIEKIRQTGYEISVVDYLGFDVDTGKCLNKARLHHEYDFAISFHYDTPKLLNIPTYLWIANPLEFMHLRGDYRDILFHNLRAYDDYLYNDSDLLKVHISNVVGSEWNDTELKMFASSSARSLTSPRPLANFSARIKNKVFYCGVNWERCADRTGRSEGLLKILQNVNAADFYGPKNLEGKDPWKGFNSYKGEIPFDGVTMARVMKNYSAVLALSSPAHMKSKTSSSRVFEGFSAGVPVISDENPHVQKLFGDLVYYFRGNSEMERAESLLDTLDHINQNPSEAREKVIRAQALISEQYSFEVCLKKVWHFTLRKRETLATQSATVDKYVDVFLFHHDPNLPIRGRSVSNFHNAAHVIETAAFAFQQHGIKVRIMCYEKKKPAVLKTLTLPVGISWEQCCPTDLTERSWDTLRLGEKVALLRQKSTGDFATFLTQCDFPHYDCFSSALKWFNALPLRCENGIHIAGFFVNTLTEPVPIGGGATAAILRQNASTSMYHWTQNSLAEHQLATLFFCRSALTLLSPGKIDRFDVILPVSIITEVLKKEYPIYRSRHILIRVENNYFQRHYEAFTKATEKGFWSQHYDLVTNYNHELNAFYDIHHESPVSLKIADSISGISTPVDPAVHMVNQALGKIRPLYRRYKRIRQTLTHFSKIFQRKRSNP